jgi:glucosamine-6-phosphate deaminase
MSVRQILKSRTILCTVPDARKARAVYLALEGAVVPEVPASILQTHPHTKIYLDRESAALLLNERG